MRNLTKTLAAVSMLAPASVYPLGIGDIKLHSFLNQKLDAEIALRLSGEEKASDFYVSIAPPDKFDEIGIPWSYFLSKIKFKTVVKANGATIIQLTSQDVLREPFLDFLVEVTWAKGHVYREFTVLVDPPSGYAQQPTVSFTETTSKSRQPTKKVSKKSYRNPASQQGSFKGSQYGPTGRRDSLWKIAVKTNQHQDVSIEQMMMAIYEANPKAFFKDNVNALKAGYTLDIPERNLILKLSRAEARSAFKQQDDIWNGRVTAKKQVQQVAAQETEINSQLKLEAPVEAEITQAINAAVDTQTYSENNLSTLSSSAEDLALQARLNKLEQQLGIMQKMLALKDEQIATMQQRSRLADGGKVKNKPVKSELAQATRTIKKESKDESVVQAKTTAKKVESPKEKAKKAKVVDTIESESGFFSNTLNWILSLLGLVILAVLGLFLWRKRQTEEETEAESMFASASEISLPDSTIEEIPVSELEDTTSYDVGTVGESSFLSEFTPSDFDAFDTDSNEVDPISEADVYLAYGRYQQAEDLMWQAIEDQPERDECKLKLLEIFNANDNKDAFEKYAKELKEAGKQDDPDFWEKVVEMGVEIAPSSSLFVENSGEAGQSGNEGIDSATNTDNEKLDVEFDVGSDKIVDIAGEIDFDLSAFSQNETDEKESQPAEDNSLDFDLSVFDVEEPAADEVQEKNETSDVVEAMDFNLDSGGLDASASNEELPKSSDESEQNTIEGIEFGSETNLEEDFGNLDFSLDNNTDSAGESETESAKIEEFDFDFDLGTDSPAAPTTSASIDDLEHSVSDLTDMDELETKIDLAKAYIDMGDVEAARGIAEEVLELGNDEQKNAALEIINQLK